MSEQNCPDCGHLPNMHNNKPVGMCIGVKNNDPRQGDCPCTRTYESLVGEKVPQFKDVEYHHGEQSPLQEVEVHCPCRDWAWDTAFGLLNPHHPNCDGHGKPKTHFVTGLSVAEPSLSLNRRKGDKYERLRGIIKQLEQEIEALTQV